MVGKIGNLANLGIATTGTKANREFDNWDIRYKIDKKWRALSDKRLFT